MGSSRLRRFRLKRGALVRNSVPISVCDLILAAIVTPCHAQSTLSTTLVSQSDYSSSSSGSSYGDNWYQLGTGFSGSLQSLTLKGYIDDSSYFSSRICTRRASSDACWFVRSLPLS